MKGVSRLGWGQVPAGLARSQSLGVTYKNVSEYKVARLYQMSVALE